MKTPSQEKEIDLYFEYKEMKVQSCGFNLKGELILFCTIEPPKNLVCIYSRQTTHNKSNKWKRQKVYKIPKRVELINISKYDKILLRLDHQIYEWDLSTGDTVVLLNDLYEVIVNFSNMTFLRKKNTNRHSFLNINE